LIGKEVKNDKWEWIWYPLRHQCHRKLWPGNRFPVKGEGTFLPPFCRKLPRLVFPHRRGLGRGKRQFLPNKVWKMRPIWKNQPGRFSPGKWRYRFSYPRIIFSRRRAQLMSNRGN
jgi:hypothetical protein